MLSRTSQPAASVPPLSNAGAATIGAACEPPPCGLQRAETSTGGAKAPNASTLCPQCGREAHKCMCPWPGDEDMMPAVEVNRIMPSISRIHERAIARRQERERIARDLGSAVVL